MYRLVIAARTADKLAETKRECEQYTTDVHTVIADVSKEGDCREIVNKAADEFGGVDILLLNAATTPTPRFFTDTVSEQVGSPMRLAHLHFYILLQSHCIDYTICCLFHQNQIYYYK